MKLILNIWLFATLLIGLSLSVTSCKDDDDNGLSEEEKEQQAIEQQEREMTGYNVLDYLANLTNAPEDYLTGSYEPTIGQPDGGNTGTRIVNTNDMATAALRFADLVDADIDENTTEYTWQQDGVGTMTYTKTNDGKSWATVDVSIKQIPHLQKIIYRSPAQADNNGHFDGTAYYRFGDVVKKKNSDGNYEFWICVRPCFGPEGKETSHWVTINALPKENIFTYKGSNRIDYALPTGLGDNHEHSKNFAELLFAICFPEDWEENITYKNAPMFHDFDRDNIKYHSKYFWQRVQNAWTDPNATVNAYGNPSGISLLASLFGTDGTLQYFKNMLTSPDGLNLLTNGFSWSTTFSNKPTLYRYRFVNGTGKESNMHKEPIKGGVFIKYHNVSTEVIKSGIQLNCIKDYSDITPGWSVEKFFGTANKHYIIRHATGAKLSSDGNEDPKLPLTGVTEVYRYNKYYSITDLSQDPEELDHSTGMVVNNKSQQKWTHYRGDPYYRFGDIYKDEQGNKWMVLLMAGMHQRYEERNRDMGDSTCFAELISFDGLTPSADKRQITNLPTRDQVMRAAPFLRYFQEYANNKKMKVEPWNAVQASELGPTIKAQLDECKFDIRMLYQLVRAQREEFWDREPSRLASIAYRDPTDNSGNQRLLRFVCNSQNEEKVGMTYYWEHYVTKPDAVTELYAENLYDKTSPIYLQDIASAEMIGLRAEDSYARQPLFSWDSWVDSTVNGPDRQPRTVKDVDPKANDVTNYYYDMDKWKTRDFPRDMWNSPVLMFRMTAVYDRGNEGHGTITVDGHTLTPVSERTNWNNSEGMDFWTILDLTYRSIWISSICKDLDSFWLDGKRIDWPDPFKAWPNK